MMVIMFQAAARPHEPGNGCDWAHRNAKQELARNGG